MIKVVEREYIGFLVANYGSFLESMTKTGGVGRSIASDE